MGVSETVNEENPSRVEGKDEISEVGKDEEGHENQEHEEGGGEADGNGAVEEKTEENAGEDEEMKDQIEEKPAAEEGAVGGNEENVGDEEKLDEKTPKTDANKRSRKGNKGESEPFQSPRSGSDRPSRERKTVERYIVPETARLPYGKPVSIENGRGTRLRDIPNVAFKLSKRKADENLQLLHTILFGKKAKVHSMKRNIGLFSGFVWIESEQEKQRSKMKEKLEKCVKEKLLDFCDLLNIPCNKATIKKEELLAKLLEFLECPHATTDNLLAEKEKGKKRKSKGLANKSPDGSSVKKQKLDSEAPKVSSGDDDKSESLQSEDAEHDEAVQDDEGSQENKDEDDDEDEEEKKDAKTPKESKKQKSVDAKTKPSNKQNISKASKSSAKSAEKSSGSSSKAKSQKPQMKKQKVEVDKTSGSNAASKKKTNSASKMDKGDGQSSKKGPSKSELNAEVVNILKRVDFNTATLSDILRQLGDHFELDLTHRKKEIKEIITEVIQNMSDDDEEEEEEEDGDVTNESGNKPEKDDD